MTSFELVFSLMTIITSLALTLFVGAAAATIVMILSAGRLSARYGAPTRLQLWFLFGSIGAEAILIRIAMALKRHAGERSMLLAILFAVGLRFLPMGMAFGPMCAIGLILCFCAGTGLWLSPRVPLNIVGIRRPHKTGFRSGHALGCLGGTLVANHRFDRRRRGAVSGNL